MLLRLLPEGPKKPWPKPSTGARSKARVAVQAVPSSTVNEPNIKNF